MSTPSDQQITWHGVLQVNLRAAGGCLILGYGWLCWEMASPQYWGFWLAAALSGAGGASLLSGALYKTCTLIGGQRRWNKLKNQGTEPRADRQPVRDDFKDGGMIR
tara:strand:- start:9709 stop:10026 length:318 start_codon:yes stop_codon:yes gene_type:complete